jgi:hypothetical protein
MLKPAEGEPPPERPISELVHELVEEGKGYAKAEIDLAKAIALAKARALAWPAGLIFAAMLVAQSAVTVFAIGVYAALYWVMGAILAGFVAFLIFSALAGAIAWYAVQRVKRDI